MEDEVQEWILLTLPEHLSLEGSNLIKECKVKEETRPRYPHKYRRLDSSGSKKSAVNSKAEERAIPLAIGRLVMDLWSCRMQKHAENLILQKTIEEGYIDRDHLKWVHALEDEKDISKFEDEWLIDDQDDVIIKLLWDVFDIKTHYSQVTSHRSFVLRSYHRLKDFMPGLQEEIIKRHDLTKYPFSQAIGYTLKWVHNISDPMWRMACDFHLFNEPHHPQTWSKVHTEEEKRKKLLKWMCGCPYGVDVASLDLNSEDFPEPFLLESYVDMVGVEWERKKGKDENISTRFLAFIDDRFLVRYTKRQHKIISDLIARITVSDGTWEEVIQTDRDRNLMATIPPDRRGIYACHLEIQRKKEERLVKSLSAESKENSESKARSSNK